MRPQKKPFIVEIKRAKRLRKDLSSPTVIPLRVLAGASADDRANQDARKAFYLEERS